MQDDVAGSDGCLRLRKCLWGAVVKGFVLMVAAGVAAVVGVIVGVVPVQVLDQGQWVACGPAMLDGGGRFADLACSGVVQPLQTLAVVLMVVAVILIGYGIVALRSTRDEAVPVARSMEQASAG